MAKPEITIQLDEKALREQVSRSIEQALVELSHKFRSAADALNPQWWVEQDAWVESEIARRVAEEREKWTTAQTS